MSEDLPSAQIAESVLDLIGNTPLVKLGRLARAHGLSCALVAKLETTNPGGSSKDRPALEMVLAAERDGLLQPGGTIVEPTSGNTGVGLAIVAAQRGYRCHFVTTDKVAPEKVDLLRAYGADVTVCPVAVPPDHPDSYYSTAERLVREIPGAYRPNQYANPANPLSHEQTTGPEIWRQTAGRVTHFVAGAGTCGTITGVARHLKRVNPAVQVIAADPEGSVFSGRFRPPLPHRGCRRGFLPRRVGPVRDRRGGGLQRRGVVPHGPPGGPGGGAAARLVRGPGGRGGHQGRPGPQHRRHGRGAHPRLRPRLPLACVQRRVDGDLRVPARVRPVRRCSARGPQRGPSAAALRQPGADGAGGGRA